MSWLTGDVLVHRFDPRRNCLNALRLALAATVILSHSWPIGGYGDDPHWGERSVGGWAVAGFFAISGYLVTASRLGTTLPDYLRRRVLRILPGFLVCLTLIAFIFAPLSTLLGPGDYSLSEAVGWYGHNLPLYPPAWSEAEIPGTLVEAYRNDWAPTLWTLGYEFGCYVLLGLIVSLVPRRLLLIVLSTLFVGVSMVLAYQLIGALTVEYWTLQGLRFLSYFLAGALLRLGQDRVRINVLWAAVAVGSLVLLAAGDCFQAFGAVPVAYLMMFLGTWRWRLLTQVGARNDISYGVYIYGWPMTQFLALVCHDQQLPVGLFALAALLLTLPWAWASWRLVERPSLRSARRGPAEATTETVGAPP